MKNIKLPWDEPDFHLYSSSHYYKTERYTFTVKHVPRMDTYFCSMMVGDDVVDIQKYKDVDQVKAWWRLWLLDYKKLGAA